MGVVFVVIVFVVFGWYWWIVGCFIEGIDDVYVCVDVVIVSLCVLGYVV